MNEGTSLWPLYHRFEILRPRFAYLVLLSHSSELKKQMLGRNPTSSAMNPGSRRRSPDLSLRLNFSPQLSVSMFSHAVWSEVIHLNSMWLYRMLSHLCPGKNVSPSLRELHMRCITSTQPSPVQSSVATSPGTSQRSHTHLTNTGFIMWPCRTGPLLTIFDQSILCVYTTESGCFRWLYDM